MGERGGASRSHEWIIVDEGLILLETILRTHVHMITMSERDEAEA